MDQLIQKAKTKDPDAFTELIGGQMQSMYKIAKSILYSDEDAADAIQDTILTCWEKLDALKNEAYFKTWLTRILINKCNDQIRRQKNFLPIEKAADLSTPGTEFENLEWNETLKNLDEKYRLVIMLYYVEGFGTKQISQILEVPEPTVRTRLARAREKLALVYEPDLRRRKLV